MNHYNQMPVNYPFHLPLTPDLLPISHLEKLWESEEDYEYLKYLYPEICNEIYPIMEEECDRLEYEGSPIFDSYPDKITLQRVANRIYLQWLKITKQEEEKDSPHIQNIIEILFYHDILYRRNRYRSRKRLYL